MTRHQDTELVRKPARTAPASGSALTRPLPRSVTIPLMLLAGFAVVLLALNFPVLHVYQKHFTQDLPEAQVPWTGLTPAMDEAALRAAFPKLTLRCMNEPTHMGDRVCFAAVRRVDGYPALTLALFLKKGKLSVAAVHVPWWGHGRAAAALQRQFGASTKASDGASTALHRWRVPGGFIDMNARRSFNLLAWSAVVWTAQAGTL
jgi:hypothetical protein